MPDKPVSVLEKDELGIPLPVMEEPIQNGISGGGDPPAPVDSHKFQSWEEAEKAHLEAQRKISEQGEQLRSERESRERLERALPVQPATPPSVAEPSLTPEQAIRALSEDPLSFVRKALEPQIELLGRAVLSVNEKLTRQELIGRRDQHIDTARAQLTDTKEQALFDRFTENGTFAKIAEEFSVNPDDPRTPQMMFEIAKGRTSQQAQAELLKAQEAERTRNNRAVIEMGSSGTATAGLEDFNTLPLDKMEERLRQLGA